MIGVVFEERNAGRYVADIVVEGDLLVELKCAERLAGNIRRSV